jgi:phosphate transporter
MTRHTPACAAPKPKPNQNHLTNCPPAQVLRPLIRDSDPATKLPQALTLAVAFGCNIGGMPTPIASPQNAAAMVAMEAKCSGQAQAQTSCELGFAEWMGVGVPVGVAMLIASYIAIIVAYRPSVARVPLFDSGARVFFSWQHNVTCLTLAATAALWCTFTFVSPYFGSLGAIGLIPVIVLPPYLHHAMRHMTHAAPPGPARQRHSRRE